MMIFNKSHVWITHIYNLIMTLIPSIFSNSGCYQSPAWAVYVGHELSLSQSQSQVGCNHHHHHPLVFHPSLRSLLHVCILVCILVYLNTIVQNPRCPTLVRDFKQLMSRPSVPRYCYNHMERIWNSSWAQKPWLRFLPLSRWTKSNPNYCRVSEWQYSNTPSCEPVPFGKYDLWQIYFGEWTGLVCKVFLQPTK